MLKMRNWLYLLRSLLANIHFYFPEIHAFTSIHIPPLNLPPPHTITTPALPKSLSPPQKSPRQGATLPSLHLMPLKLHCRDSISSAWCCSSLLLQLLHHIYSIYLLHALHLLLYFYTIHLLLLLQLSHLIFPIYWRQLLQLLLHFYSTYTSN